MCPPFNMSVVSLLCFLFLDEAGPYVHRNSFEQEQDFSFSIPARAGTRFWPVFPARTARTEQKSKQEQDFDWVRGSNSRISEILFLLERIPVYIRTGLRKHMKKTSSFSSFSRRFQFFYVESAPDPRSLFCVLSLSLSLSLSPSLSLSLFFLESQWEKVEGRLEAIISLYWMLLH